MGELGAKDAEHIDKNMWAPQDTEGQQQDEVRTAFLGRDCFCFDASQFTLCSMKDA